jgi:hypothetical protein
MAFFRKNQRNSRDKKPPLFSAQVTDRIGFAVWMNEETGIYEVKLGQSFYVTDRETGKKRLIVRTVLPLTAFGEIPEAVESVARMFATVNDFDVSDELRQDLSRIATTLETAIVPTVETELKLNGATDHFRSLRQ